MTPSPVQHCACLQCRSRESQPERGYRHQINVFLSQLNEPQRRWFAALEATRINYGGKPLLAQITGLSPTAIGRGCSECVPFSEVAISSVSLQLPSRWHWDDAYQLPAA